jgi:hypothetical protein
MRGHARETTPHFNSQRDNIVTVSHAVALSELTRSLPAFIQARISGFHKTLRAFRRPNFLGLPWYRPRLTQGGFPITVSCRAHGYRVHASPSILGAFSVFGAPTTPVAGNLPWGKWIFAGDNGGALIQDSGTFDIPTVTHVTLTAF